MLAPINLRFAELIQAVGLTKNAFAQSLGKTASVVQHLIDGRNKPGYDLLCKVFEVYPNVSKDWLLEGTGPMLLVGGPKAAPVPAALPKAAVALQKAPAAAPLFAASASAPVPAPEAPEPAPAMPAAPVPAAALEAPAAPAPVASAVPPTAAPGGPNAAAPPAGLGAEAAIGAALQTQHLLHQLALAELRNQHLLEQQVLLRQLLEQAQNR